MLLRDHPAVVFHEVALLRQEQAIPVIPSATETTLRQFVRPAIYSNCSEPFRSSCHPSYKKPPQLAVNTLCYLLEPKQPRSRTLLQYLNPTQNDTVPKTAGVPYTCRIRPPFSLALSPEFRNTAIPSSAVSSKPQWASSGLNKRQGND
jgi:hypothetical protein